VTRIAVLVCFAVALAAGVLVAADRAHSLESSDTTSPVGRVSLPATVRSPSVTLKITVADPESGVVELRMSNDDKTWSAWVGYPSPSPDGTIHLDWRLSPGPGPKTVTVEASNGAGLVSSFRADTVLLPAAS
jgi:hypothetical protein